MNVEIAAPEHVVSPPSSRIVRPRSPQQMSYSDLRKRIKELESLNADFSGRNEALESRREEDREQIENLHSRLASFDRAELELKQAAESHLKQALAVFNSRAVAVRQKFPDFDAVIESNPNLRHDVLRAVVEMEKGPFVLYSLIKSPDLCRQLNPLPLGTALEKIFNFALQTEQKLIQETVAANYFAATKGK